MKRKVYETVKETCLDFALGFVGWFVINSVGCFVINVLLALLVFGQDFFDLPYSASRQRMSAEGVALRVLCVGVIPLLINLGGVVLLASPRKWIALGALTAFTITFFLALSAGLYSLLARHFLGVVPACTVAFFLTLCAGWYFLLARYFMP